MVLPQPVFVCKKQNSFGIAGIINTLDYCDHENVTHYCRSDETLYSYGDAQVRHGTQ